MHRITKLTIENYRGFYNAPNTDPYTLDLPNGENLLLYGENGSGKSSLLMAVREWMNSGDQPWDAEKDKNIWARPVDSATIEISLTDFSNPIGAATIITRNMGNTLNDPLVKNAFQGHGWLTYRELIKSYLLDPKVIFQLIVLEILGDQKPNNSTYSIKEMWSEIQEFRKPDENGNYPQLDEKQLFGSFNELVDHLVIHQLQPLVNQMLSDYFKIGVKVIFSKSKVSIGKHANGRPITLRERARVAGVKILNGDELELFIEFHEEPFANHGEKLNEARLNAIALSMFLSARVMTPTHYQGQIRTLLLDDIFVGLDTSNRIPLLKLLTDHDISFIDHEGNSKTVELFQNYQIIVATYDRYWFNVARNWLHSRLKDQWRYYEMYVYSLGTNSAGLQIDQPILKPYGDNFGTGMRYFRDKHHPDYTAAANFFRKAAEELLTDFLPPKRLEEVRSNKRKDDTDPEPKAVMLKDLIAVSIDFLMQLGEPVAILDDLRDHLRTLLNPLSHFEREQSPVFRQELDEIVVILRDKLPPFLDDVKSRVKEVLPRGNKIRIRFRFGSRHVGYFELISGSDLFRVVDKTTGTKRLSMVKFLVSHGFENDRGLLKTHKDKPPKGDVEKFNGIEDAYSYLVAQFPGASTMPNYIDACKFVLGKNKERPLKELLL
jgi:energy-coupling factor transporter ATP-binding protein EcfA2